MSTITSLSTLSPAVLAAANKVALGAQNAVFNPDENPPGGILIPAAAKGGYRIIYAASRTCRDKHDLVAIGKLSINIPVFYYNASPVNETLPTGLPGTHLQAISSRNDVISKGTANINKLSEYRLNIWSPMVALIDPSGEVVGLFRSKDQNFITNVTKAIATHKSKAAGISL